MKALRSDVKTLSAFSIVACVLEKALFNSPTVENEEKLGHAAHESSC